jgi:hypothetical protein
MNYGNRANGIHVTCSILLVITAATAVCQQPISNQKSALKTGGSINITMDGLLRVLARFRDEKVPGAMAIELTRMYGLAFRPTPEDLAKLKAAGASNDLLKAIDKARKPAEEVVVKQGTLAIACQPGDCNVALNGNPVGMTTRGRLTRINLPEGRIAVMAAKEDYELDRSEEVVFIRANQTTGVEFNFKVTRAALDAAGARLFMRMVEALGGEAGLKETGFVRATGTARVYDRKGKPAAWSLVTLIRTPDKTKFSVARAGQRYEIAKSDEGYRWSKPPKGQESQDLEDALQLIREYQIATLIDRLKKTRISLVAEHIPPVAGEDVVLRAECSPDSYVIALDSDFRPRQVRIESSGLNSGLRILFSEYSA